MSLLCLSLLSGLIDYMCVIKNMHVHIYTTTHAQHSRGERVVVNKCGEGASWHQSGIQSNNKWKHNHAQENQEVLVSARHWDEKRQRYFYYSFTHKLLGRTRQIWSPSWQKLRVTTCQRGGITSPGKCLDELSRWGKNDVNKIRPEL